MPEADANEQFDASDEHEASVQDHAHKAAEGQSAPYAESQRDDLHQDAVDEASAQAQETVQEFMAEAAQQNVAAQEAMPEERNHPVPYIAFDHVSIAFGDMVVLDDVSFSVLPGETLCILGRSGVGKSVALKILMGFLKPDKGRVLVAGEDITQFSELEMQAVRRKVTMVFQNGALSIRSRWVRMLRFLCASEAIWPRTRSNKLCAGCWRW